MSLEIKAGMREQKMVDLIEFFETTHKNIKDVLEDTLQKRARIQVEYQGNAANQYLDSLQSSVTQIDEAFTEIITKFKDDFETTKENYHRKSQELADDTPQIVK